MKVAKNGTVAGDDRAGAMALIFGGIIALIVYGSLYPWTFRVPPGAANPLVVLLHAWPARYDRRFVADIVINIALYLPLGMSGFLAFRNSGSRWLRLAGPLASGALLSITVETIQYYSLLRDCSAIDVLDNVLGTLAGMAFGRIFESLAGRVRLRGRRGEPDRAGIMLLLTWAGSLTFPLYPVLWLHLYREKLRLLTHSSLVEPLVFAGAAMSWFAAGRILKRLGAPRPLLWTSVALIPAQFFIVSRQPAVTEFLGAIAGSVAVSFWKPRRVAWWFVGVLLLRGLAPFQFSAPHGFSWLPFEGFLEMDWQAGIRVLLEKAWYFGAAIWLLRREEMRLIPAVSVVTGVAALVEFSQIFLAGRTAEITDPLLALMVGFLVAALRDRNT